MAWILLLPISTGLGKYRGQISGQLQKMVKAVWNNASWIVAHALELDVALVTNNRKEFCQGKAVKVG